MGAVDEMPDLHSKRIASYIKVWEDSVLGLRYLCFRLEFFGIVVCSCRTREQNGRGGEGRERSKGGLGGGGDVNSVVVWGDAWVSVFWDVG